MRGSELENRNNKSVSKDTIIENTQLIDWVISIYGIYWGVWLGFFVDKIAHNLPEGLAILSTIVSPLFFSYLPLIIIIGFSIMIVSYTFFLIKWFWTIRYVSAYSPIMYVIKKNRPLIHLMIGTILSIMLLGFIYKTSIIWVGAGIWATIGWIVVILFIVFSDRREWR